MGRPKKNKIDKVEQVGVYLPVKEVKVFGGKKEVRKFFKKIFKQALIDKI